MYVDVKKEDIIETVYDNIDLMDIIDYFVLKGKTPDVMEAISRSDLDEDDIMKCVDIDNLIEYAEMVKGE
jgi:hypothetical protein